MLAFRFYDPSPLITALTEHATREVSRVFSTRRSRSHAEAVLRVVREYETTSAVVNNLGQIRHMSADERDDYFGASMQATALVRVLEIHARAYRINL